MMNYQNPRYNALGTIDCEIEHPVLGWIPTTLSPEDDATAALYGSVLSGGNISNYIEPPAERAMIAKSTVMQRIIDAGKMGSAFAALTANPIYFARWFAPDHPAVFSDDPDAVAFVVALDLDPATILAPA